MRAGLIGKKLGMTSMFDDSGKRLTLTFLEVDNCQVVGKRSVEKDGYSALVIGAKKAKLNRVAKAQKVVYAKNKIEPKAILKEFRVSRDDNTEIGTDMLPSYFQAGQYIDVTGRSIGKGFAGAMKRHNFKGLEETHGVSVSHRSHGSTGQCQDPGKVFKGKKMAGHMGDSNITMQNLVVHKADDEKGLLIVIGNVPGSKGSYVVIKDAIKKSSIV